MEDEYLLDSDIDQNSPTTNSESGLNEEQNIESYGAILAVTPEVISVVGPGRSKQWIPNCSNELKPALGLKFNNLNEGIEFYKKYAIAAGFNTRRSTRRLKNDVVTTQNFLCNKAGYKRNKSTSTHHKDGTTKRKRLVTRVGCNARIVLKQCEDGGYLVAEFVEEHNHTLYTPGCVKFQKEGRNINILHKKMIVDNSKLNIGPIRTYRQISQFAGGYENVGASKEDFKNFQRDLKTYIMESDAQMFLDNFKNKKLLWPAYFFEYEVDEEDKLCRVLWVDPICKKNYALYGDMISFDTTYGTNRYNMIFAPFTGVDNHKSCITFAVALIAKEDVASFEWIFRTFIKAMDNNEPRCMITDQDPAMTIAINNVFQKTQHRYCTWHITRKFPEKLGREFIPQKAFLKKINSFLWNVKLEPEEFVELWKKVISEFELDNHDWFQHIFDMRSMWIPAYFRELFLGGLMRTTSRSESENNFYSRFTNSSITLVEFNMRYETAMDSQRHDQDKNDNDCKYKQPICRTPMEIEKHGAELFTTTIFYEFRKEVYVACFMCGLEDLQKENGVEIYIVKQKKCLRTYKVAYNPINNATTCSCKLFERNGIPCRHMIWVWKTKMLEKIPEQYVLNRWTIYAAQKPIFDLDGNVLEQCAAAVNKKRKLNELWSEIHMCVSLAQGNDENLDDLVKNIGELRKGLETKINGNNMNATSKVKEIEMLIGTTKPAEILIKEPRISKNKGTGVHITNTEKRMKSHKEIAVEKQKKSKRMCKGCQQLAHHDIRNCPQRQK